MITNYQDTERYKKSKSLESSTARDGFDNTFNSIFGVNDSRPKVKCEV